MAAVDVEKVRQDILTWTDGHLVKVAKENISDYIPEVQQFIRNEYDRRASIDPAFVVLADSFVVAPKDSHLVGIGGWLIIPMISFFTSPILSIYTVVVNFLPLFRDGTIGQIIAGEQSFSSIGWIILAIVELASKLFFVVFPIYLLVIMFKRESQFPKMSVFFYLFNFGFICLDSLLGFLLVGNAASYLQEIARSGGQALVWVPYFLRSVRIKNTFRSPTRLAAINGAPIAAVNKVDDSGNPYHYENVDDRS